MPWSRAPKIAMEGNCRGTRPASGPTQRWGQLVKADLAVCQELSRESGIDHAQDRAAWKETVREAVTKNETKRAEKLAKRKEAKRQPAAAFVRKEDEHPCTFP